MGIRGKEVELAATRQVQRLLEEGMLLQPSDRPLPMSQISTPQAATQPGSPLKPAFPVSQGDFDLSGLCSQAVCDPFEQLQVSNCLFPGRSVRFYSIVEQKRRKKGLNKLWETFWRKLVTEIRNVMGKKVFIPQFHASFLRPIHTIPRNFISHRHSELHKSPLPSISSRISVNNRSHFTPSALYSTETTLDSRSESPLLVLGSKSRRKGRVVKSGRLGSGVRNGYRSYYKEGGGVKLPVLTGRTLSNSIRSSLLVKRTGQPTPVLGSSRRTPQRHAAIGHILAFK